MVNAKTFLEKRYNDDIELEDAIHTAIRTGPTPNLSECVSSCCAHRAMAHRILFLDMPFLSSPSFPPMSHLVLCSVLCSALKHDGLLAAWLPTDCEFSPMPCFIT